MSSFLKGFIKGLDEDVGLVSDSKGAAEFSGYIDTGCYILNALFSSSIFGGVPNNKISAIAGESATGKSFFVLSMVRHFLETKKEGVVFFFDTEAAVTKEMMETRGIDTSRVVLLEPDSIQKFRHQALKILDRYGEIPKDKRPPSLMVLDSLGMLSSSKELADTAEGKETKDMTKASLIRATFRVLTLKCAKVEMPLLVTNHVYASIGCLDETQFVRLDSGSLRGIADIKIGDVVQTLSGPRTVSNLYSYDVEEFVELHLEDGSTIKATPNHKFMLSDGKTWKAAEDITELDDLLVVEPTLN